MPNWNSMWSNQHGTCHNGPFAVTRSRVMLICQLTDLHVCAVGASCNRMLETNMFAARAFRTVAGMKPAPDVVLITGDLTENGMPAEYANLAALIRQHLTMPVYVIPGNHDRRDNCRRDLAHLPGVADDPV